MIAETSWPEFWTVWSEGRWEPETQAVICEHMTGGGTFVDLGAWIGPTTLWALEAGADRVVAVEPDPVACTVLRDNVPGGKVDVVAQAVAAAAGPVWLHEGRECWGDSMSTMTLRPDAPRLQVQATTLPALWEDHGIGLAKLVKMDVEGAEADILEAHGDWLRSHCAALLLSVHGTWGGRDPLPFLADWQVDEVARSEFVAVPR